MLYILLGNKNDQTMTKNILAGRRKSVEVNATQNNFIANLTSIYHGVKCQRVASHHQKVLKVTTLVD